MNKLLEEAIEHVRALPEADQEKAAEALLDFATRRDVQLSDEQLAELRRRRADKNGSTITVEESRRRLRDIGA